MKKVFVIALLMLTASSASALVSFHLDFSYHGDLSCHGRWVSMADVGNVWVPRVHISWSPYTYGHWAWSHWGWMWVSHEPWHVTYHYGRWLWTDYHGWVWVPGRVWAPAWVVWSCGPGWVGWAPMPPDWRHGYWSRSYYHRHHGRWVVVRDRGFLSGTVWKEKLPEYRVKNIVNDSFDTKFKGRTRFSGPPERDYVEKTTGVAAEHIGRERVKTLERDRLASLAGRDNREKVGDSREPGEPLESTRIRERSEETRERHKQGPAEAERDISREPARTREYSREPDQEARSSRERSVVPNQRTDERRTERPAQQQRDEPSSQRRERSHDERSNRQETHGGSGYARPSTYDSSSHNGSYTTHGNRSRSHQTSDSGRNHGSRGSSSGGGSRGRTK